MELTNSSFFHRNSIVFNLCQTFSIFIPLICIWHRYFEFKKYCFQVLLRKKDTFFQFLSQFLVFSPPFVLILHILNYEFLFDRPIQLLSFQKQQMRESGWCTSRICAWNSLHFHMKSFIQNFPLSHILSTLKLVIFDVECMSERQCISKSRFFRVHVRVHYQKAAFAFTLTK